MKSATASGRDFADVGADMGDGAIVAAIMQARRPGDISATPFQWCDPATIAPRPWVYGHWFLRNTITAVVAPGGVGKSALMASTILALTTGRELLGKTIWDGPQRVWYWNLEDDGEELSRQVHAAASRHRVRPDDCGDRLLVDSGLDGATLCLASADHDGFRIQTPVVEALVAELKAKRIDVLIVDPFVSSHTVSENDNGAIDAVAKEWARVAKRASCAIVLVHHTRKLAGQKVTAEMSRGAVALISAARTALVLNRMDEQEMARFGIDGDRERRRYFTVQDDKHNRAPAEDAEWYRIEGVDLGNGPNGAGGDNIGVVTRWTPPDVFDGVSADHLREVQKRIAQGEYLKSDQSPDWVGRVVADIIELDADDDTDRRRIKRIIAQWVKNGVLAEEVRRDRGKGRERPYIIVGRWLDTNSPPPHHFPTATSEVGEGFPTPPPHKGGGGGGGPAGTRFGRASQSEVGKVWHPNPALGKGNTAPRDMTPKF